MWENVGHWQASEWDAALAALPGATFYQSHGWGEVKRRLGWEVVRLVKRDAGIPVALAQILLRRYPLGGAVCWIPGGPAGEIGIWADDIGAVLKRLADLSWLYMRTNALRPHDDADVAAMRRADWRSPSARLSSGLSLAYDPSVTESGRLAAASGNWRHNLKRSAKYPQTVRRWLSPMADELRGLYTAMEEHKSLPEQVSGAEIGAMIDCLGEHMILYRCDDAEGQIIALRACAMFADTAWDLLAAASPQARKQYASHATLWALFRDCGERGIRHYDMGGVDPEGNRGVYDFKKGLGATPLSYLGEWEWASPAWLCPVANFAFRHRRG